MMLCQIMKMSQEFMFKEEFSASQREADADFA